jgi:hypothetical protein
MVRAVHEVLVRGVHGVRTVPVRTVRIQVGSCAGRRHAPAAHLVPVNRT